MSLSTMSVSPKVDIKAGKTRVNARHFFVGRWREVDAQQSSPIFLLEMTVVSFWTHGRSLRERLLQPDGRPLL